MKDTKDVILENLFKYSLFFLGTFLLGLSYNLLLAPNDLIVGGMSGLGLVLKSAFGWNDQLFIYISSGVLLVVSYIFLGKETSRKALLGSVLYPLMITFTLPLANVILKYNDISEFLIIVSLAGLLYGVSNGLIYKMGFNTGGGDIIMHLISKYTGMSNSRSSVLYNTFILIISGFTFGISSFIYSMIIMAISTLIINKIDLGIASKRLLFIASPKITKIKKYLKDLNMGYTEISKKSDFLKMNGVVIMVVVPNRDYNIFKNAILNIDPKAFMVINDCYDVENGKTSTLHL